MVFSLFLLLLFSSFGCSSTKEENVNFFEEDVFAEEEIAEENKIPDWDPLFDLLQKEEGFVLSYFDETPLSMDSSLVYFQQNIIIDFVEEKVDSIRLFEGNKILGFQIEENFVEKDIIFYFGKPSKKSIENERVYLMYLFPKKIKILFWEEKDGGNPMAEIMMDH